MLTHQLIVISLLVLIGCPAITGAQTDVSSTEQHAEQAIDHAIQQAGFGQYWGTALVARNGEILLDKGYGFANYQDIPNTPTTLFEIASLSKQFTAAGIYRLAMDGQLQVNDEVSKYIPAFADEKAAITIHQLLTHTSGISPNLGLPYASTATRDELISKVANAPLASTPGEKFAYCNVGYAVLAAIIEVVSEQSFEQYLKEHLFEPAGLEHTGFIRDKALLEFPVSSRSRRSSPRMKLTATEWYWGWGYRGMGGVVTSTHDLLRWHQALNTNRVLGQDAKNQMFTTNLNGYASGWMVDLNNHGGSKVFHSGRVLGYGSFFARYPDDNTVVILLSNGETNLPAIAQAIEKILYPLPAIDIVIDVEAYELDEYHAVIQTGDWSWQVADQSDGIALILTNPLNDTPIARIDVPTQIARNFAADLRRTIKEKTASTAPTETSSRFGIYLSVYGGNKSIKVEDITLSVMPRYSGRDTDGSRIIDNRITFTARDSAQSFWPMMTLLSDQDAADLLKNIEDTLGEL